jgi:hypothetical protein
LRAAAGKAVLAGENRIAVMASNGVWEIIGFTTAEEIAPKRWRLSGLLRGLAGTEDANAAGATVGSACVVLDEAVVSLGLTDEERGRPLNWLAESLGRSGGRSGPYVFAGGVRAQTPLAPVHVEAVRRAGGDIAVSWIRRGRIDADSWDALDIPMDEPDERYLVEVMAGGEVRRSAEVSTSSFVYSTTDELADFGSGQDLIDVRVRQRGRVVPFGIPARAVINL